MAINTLYLTSDTKKPNKLGLITIYVRYKRGNTKRKKSSGIKIPYSIWDEKKSEIRTQYRPKYPSEVKRFSELKSQFNGLIIEMDKGKLTWEGAFHQLFNTRENQTIQDYIEKSKLPEDTKRKYSSYIRAIEYNLMERGQDRELTLDMLTDLDVCRVISNNLNKSGLKPNTIRDYLAALDHISRHSKSPIKNIFKDNGLRPSYTRPEPKYASLDDLNDGLNRINTLQDLEAYLFWLYSYCLLGMDGIDICNIDEGLVMDLNMGNKTLNHYSPEGNQDDKIHIEIIRGKTAKKSPTKMTLLINLFPTLFIKDWLHSIIERTRPGLAYKGSDRLRLFNFKTRDEKGNIIPESVAKWKAIRDTHSSKLKKMIGVTTQQTRHTVTAIGLKIGMTDEALNRQLGHKTKTILKHYLTEVQPLKDIDHIYIIQEGKIIQLLNTLNTKFARFYTKEYLFAYPDEIKEIETINLLKANKLIGWTRQQELDLQRMMTEIDSEWKIIDGINTKVQISEKDYPKELKDLIKERKKSISAPFFKIDSQ